MSTAMDDLVELMTDRAKRLVMAAKRRDVLVAHAVFRDLGLVEVQALAVRLAALVPPSVDQLRLATRARLQCRSGQAALIRQRAGASRGELAAVVGVHEQTIGSWETGKDMPRGDNAIQFGAVLDALQAGLGEK